MNEHAEVTPPVVVKKYANRRLYNTGTSVYVTLEDLAQMVKQGHDFVVFDAKTNEEITRSVLTQIIFEQEAKDGQSLLPIAFLRQLIRFYGDSMQMLVPTYLEFSMDRLTRDSQSFRDRIAGAFGGTAAERTRALFAPMEEQARSNMALFTSTLSMFNPFVSSGLPGTAGLAPKPEDGDLTEMRRQLAAMQRRLDTLSKD